MEIVLILALIGLGGLYLVNNKYIDLDKIDISHIDNNTIILIAMAIIVLILLFRGFNGRGGHGGGRRGSRGGRGRR